MTSLHKSGKQFITVVTRNNNYFYLIIDRDDEGNQTVHFLNQVDEEDFFHLMDEEDDKAVQEAMNEQKAQTTQAEETVKPEKEPEKEATEQEVEAPKKKQTGSSVCGCRCADHCHWRHRDLGLLAGKEEKEAGGSAGSGCRLSRG